MINKSLNSIMNKMARSHDIVCPEASQHSKLERLSELEAFAVLDETLDAMHKQYMDSKAQRKELVALNGADDAMAVVAIDMEDSAWCAMQTRYIEVRAKRELMVRAQQMMRQRDVQIEELSARVLQSDKAKKAHDFANYLKILKVMKERNRTPAIIEWLAVFLFLDINIFRQPQQSKNSYSLVAA